MSVSTTPALPLKAGKAKGKNAAADLSSASEGLDDALDENCAPATP